MQKTTSILLMGAVIAMGLGVYGASEFLSDTQSSALSSGSLLTGHLTLTAYDEDGNIKAYRQTDNIVLNTADNCMSEILFTLSSGNGCTTATKYDFIHIGTGSDAGVSEGDVDPLPITFNAVDTSTDSIVLTNATGSGGADTKIIATFLNVNANIDEAALRNSATQGGGNALAYQQFTVINLGTADDLTVEWTITIDGN